MKYPTSVEFFPVEFTPAYEGFEPKWYWRDELCEEDIGPFDTRAQAVRDYKEIRAADHG